MYSKRNVPDKCQKLYKSIGTLLMIWESNVAARFGPPCVAIQRCHREQGMFIHRIHFPASLKPNAQRETELNWTVQFSSVSRCALNRRRPATIRRRNRRQSQVLHNRDTLVNRPINAMSIAGRKPATSCDDWRRPSQVCRRPSPVVAGSMHSGKLN